MLNSMDSADGEGLLEDARFGCGISSPCNGFEARACSTTTPGGHVSDRVRQTFDCEVHQLITRVK